MFSQVPRNAVHPNDHRNDEHRGQKKQQAFKAVLVDLPAFQGNGHRQAERSGNGYARPDETGKLRTARSREINEYDANDESGFDAFAERDEKSREQESSS